MAEDLDVLELADKLFTGALPIESHHPFSSSGKLAEIVEPVTYASPVASTATANA